MKIFNNFSELAQSKVLTGTPVRVLKPALVDGMVEASGEGLSLLSGNVFVGQFVDQESVTARKTSLLDDAFTGGISAYINRYEKNNSGDWVAAADGRTSAVFYSGQLWWPLVEIPYTANGYLITSWGLPTGNPDILEVSTSAGTVFQFNRFTGLVDGGTSGGSIVSETPPNNPLAGNRWTRCSDMKSFIWYVDSEGSQWIEDNPSMGAVSHNGMPDRNAAGAHDAIYSRVFANVGAMLAYDGLLKGQRYSTGGTTWEYLGTSGGGISDFKKLTKAVEDVTGVSLFPLDVGASLVVGDVIPSGTTALTIDGSVYYIANQVDGSVTRIDLNNLRVTAGGQTSNLLKISTDTKSKSTHSDYRSVLLNADISDKKLAAPWFVRTATDQYQFSVPLGRGGEVLTYRMTNSESSFDAGTNVGDRPFRITTRKHSKDSVYSDLAYSDSIPLGSWAVSGLSRRSNVAGEKLIYRFKGNSLRVTLNGNTSNGGIAWFRVDGSSDRCNLLPKDGSGNAFIDNGVAGAIQVVIADGLDSGWHELQIIVSGQTNTTDAYVYVAVANGVRTFGAPLNKTPAQDATYSQSEIFRVDDGVSAVSYAYNFAMNPAGPNANLFIGDLHGYEERTSAVLYVDEIAYDMTDGSIAVGDVASADSAITVVQTTNVFHPDSLGAPVAKAQIVVTFSKDGVSLKHKWDILQDIVCVKGHTTMWTCKGGASGGDPTDPNGWNDQALFVGGYNEPLQANDDRFSGRYPTSQVVFWGTEKLPSEPSRRDDCSSYACLVNVDDYFQSTGGTFGYDNNSFKGSYFWDRATYNKLYFNSIEQLYIGNGGLISGGCTVEHFYSKQMSNIMNANISKTTNGGG